MAVLNGNGALDTSTHRLVNRVMDEIHAHRLDPVRAHPSEAPTQELRPGASKSPRRRNPLDRYPQV